MISVVVPVKPLADALQRLSGVLDPDGRRALQAAMLTDVLEAAAGFSDQLVVVTNDGDVANLARMHGARVAPDASPSAGINVAVDRALCAGGNATAAMVVMGDLPMATSGDLRNVAAAAPAGRGVSVAVSGDGTGTNAMLMSPPGVIRPSFGAGSLARHLAAADAAGVECTVVTAPGLMLDVDTPEDLAALARSGTASHAARLCRALRLDAAAAMASQG